jgi:ferredoxin
MGMVSANDPDRPKRHRAKLDQEMCLGCGVCVRNCPQDAIHLRPRPERVITPVDSVQRVVMMAIERGKLQNLIFDNQALTSHRAMAAIFGAILGFASVKQALAGRQVRSLYLERILQTQH